jgi:hypothetical protein
MPRVVDHSEVYIARAVITAAAVMSASDFTKVCAVGQIIPNDEGLYPILAFLRALNAIRKQSRYSTTGAPDVDRQLKLEKIKAQQINNSLKLKELISRRSAIDRMQTTCRAVASKIRYAIKNVSPLLHSRMLPNTMNVHDVENVLVEHYNIALEELTKAADNNTSWEDYDAGLQPTGVELVDNTEENSDVGSNQEDEAADKE